MDMQCQHKAQWLMIFGLFFLLILTSNWACHAAALSSDQVSNVESGDGRIFGCLPCSQAYLASSYFDHRNSLLELDFHDFLAQEFGTGDLCRGLANDMNVLGLADLHRHLSGEGSHRHVVSTLTFVNQSDGKKWLDSHSCEAVIIEKLPIGVFADPFELQHLVHRRAFLDAAVFGDSNLELPSALSNRSIVEIHMDIRNDLLENYETVIQLPLHARYPPLDSSGYARIEIGRPDLFIRCRPKQLQPESCSWTLKILGAGYAKNVMWQVPCGNEAHTGIVSSITFATALMCVLLIVLSAIYFSGSNSIKCSL
ncbi:phosphatidylinositol-glycan biosynthesis class X protein-like isoform X3 [Phoenix dactylifera]|uniref:Phosphatidylinositol-glycan biosynthesis class X protein-like isoform X3 n=1 Tax=Phoenix dactylifera TaxID=42345 RepID=A0A8B9A5J7_PHODC|nr:phosphatidylinositol-glycan biosynthesis class X protein-like isoform X3 [Phoenix dactylifera]